MRSVVRLVAGVVLVVVFYGAALFAPAGTFDWPRAWVLLALTTVATTISSAYLQAVSPEIVRERWKPPVQRGQPIADRVLVMGFLVLYVATIVLSALDVLHWRLLPRPGRVVSAAGLAAYLAAWPLNTLVLRENAFASAAVRHQAERQQRVIDTGPYAIVRHPMYAGSLPLVFGLPLWLGSYTAALAGIAAYAVLVARILGEESYLRRELPGYAEYMQRVRWRLVPGVW